MKNFYAPKGSKISINNGESELCFDLYSDSGFELLSNLMLKVGAERKLMYQEYLLEGFHLLINFCQINGTWMILMKRSL